MLELLHINQIDLLCVDQIDRTARTAIMEAGGAIEEGSDGRSRVTIPAILDQRDLFGDGRLSNEFLQSDTNPWGFRWVPLYKLPSGQWLKAEVYDENRLTGEHRRRLAVCDLETEIVAWIKRREDYRAAGGSPRPDWEVGLAPRPWKPGESHTPGINPETTSTTSAT